MNVNNKCSPNVALDFNNAFTCFSLNQLITVSKLYNNWIKNDKTICKQDQCITSKSPIDLSNVYKKCKELNYCNNINIKRELWEQIYKRLLPLCESDESCWIDMNFLKNDNFNNKTIKKIKLFTFKPKKIHNEKNWLNTTDINNVLNQYQELDKKFKFLGALPSDFYKIDKINFAKFKKYKKLGMVLNLDGYEQSGSHWVAIYIDKNKKQIEYFDSLGRTPNTNIKYYIKEYLNNEFPNYEYLQNKYKHQLLDTECGVYSIYYIINRLLGFSFQYITSNVIRDDDMKRFRKYIFM